MLGVIEMSDQEIVDFDPAAMLDSPESIAVFIQEAFKAGDAHYIAHALGVAARAKGMTKIAAETGLSREQLYRSFSMVGNPTLKTALALMKALNIRLEVEGTMIIEGKNR